MLFIITNQFKHYVYFGPVFMTMTYHSNNPQVTNSLATANVYSKCTRPGKQIFILSSCIKQRRFLVFQS